MEKIKELIGLKRNQIKFINENKNVVISQDILEECGLKNIQLRSYQLEGVKWLVARFKAHMGSILADEMGLGKTCQAISFLTYLYGSKTITKPSLILLPLSVVHNWKLELSKFSPNLKFLAYLGSKEEREELRKRHKSDFDDGSTKLLVTTYEICLKDESFLRSFDWEVIVVDEAHRLKNNQSLLHAGLIEFGIDHWLLLTGTPIQNNLKELFSLLSLCCRDIFREEYCRQFLEYYEDLTSSGRDIKSIVQDIIIRRVKSQVVLDLPERSEVILYHGLTSLQSRYYRGILAKDVDVFLANSSKKKNRLMNILMELRKCVCHPYLFEGVEPEPFKLGEHLVEASGKLLLLDGLLRHLKSTGHKVLLFSQMTSHLDIVQDYMTLRKYSYERLDGSVRSEERNVAVNNFNQDELTFAFLLSTRAGGQGLNLTSADTVVFLDSDFNPQNDLQAAARAHRIGQKRNVKVIRLVGRHSVEEIILKRADDKLQLTRAVMSSSNADDVEDHVKLEDIIKFGLEMLFAENQKTPDVDFEDILGKSRDGEWAGNDKTDVDNIASKTKSLIVHNSDEIHAPSCSSIFHHHGDSDDGKVEPSVADKRAFEEILDEEMSKRQFPSASSSSVVDDIGSRWTRRNKTLVGMEVLRDKTRKPRVPLTAEQLEERRKKRLEREEQIKRLNEERRSSREKERLERRMRLWQQNGYSSSKLASGLEEDRDDGSVDDDGFDDEDDGGNSSRGHGPRSCDSVDDDDDNDNDETDDDDDDDDDGVSTHLHYVVGDVTRPVTHDVLKKRPGLTLVVHCVDDSGRWGKGGLFTGIQKRSPKISEKYELAGKMNDLNLGDVHVFPLDDGGNGNEQLALLVVQSRDRNGRLKDIDMDHLQKAFEKLSGHAGKNKASLHFPRIGHSRSSSDWYSIERMLKKYFSSRKIHTFVYYFPRGSSASQKRKLDVDEPSTSSSKRQATTSGARFKDQLSRDLPDFLRGISVHFLRDGGDFVVLDDEEKKRIELLSRHVVAYDGDVKSDSSSPTHLIPMGGVKAKILPEDFDGRVVDVRWLLDSIKNQRIMEEDEYLIST